MEWGFRIPAAGIPDSGIPDSGILGIIKCGEACMHACWHACWEKWAGPPAADSGLSGSPDLDRDSGPDCLTADSQPPHFQTFVDTSFAAAATVLLCANTMGIVRLAFVCNRNGTAATIVRTCQLVLFLNP